MALDLGPYLNKLHHRRARQHTDTLNRLNGLRPPPIMVGDRAGEPWFDDEVEALCHEIMRLSREAHDAKRAIPPAGAAVSVTVTVNGSEVASVVTEGAHAR